MCLVVVAGELWETGGGRVGAGFPSPVGRRRVGGGGPALHRAAALRPGEVGGRGEERGDMPQPVALSYAAR